jgi:predicted secreted protein
MSTTISRTIRVVVTSAAAFALALSATTLSASAATSADANKVVYVHSSAEGHTVHVPLARTIAISLNENPSTGEVWTTLAGASPGTVLVQIGAKFTPNKKGDPNGPGTQLLLFAETKVGTATLVIGKHAAHASFYTTVKYVVVVSKSQKYWVSKKSADIATTRYPVVAPKRTTTK